MCVCVCVSPYIYLVGKLEPWRKWDRDKKRERDRERKRSRRRERGEREKIEDDGTNKDLTWKELGGGGVRGGGGGGVE